VFSDKYCFIECRKVYAPYTLFDHHDCVREATDDLLAIDERADGWTFDDAPFDSGPFGELVSRDIVVKHDGEYGIVDSDAVRASLDSDCGDEPEDGDQSGSSAFSSFSFPSESRETVGALGGALLFVAAMRAYFVGHVFRPDGVLLSSNDPYYYRYWVDQSQSRPSAFST